jgi:hypothetical protein
MLCVLAHPKSYLLVLLTLKAYQQHIAAAAAASSAAAGAAVPSGGSGFDEVSALGCILQNFLRLAAQLSSSTLLTWEVQCDRDTVQQVLTRPELAAGLRPKGCEQHPIVLDPFCPTYNVAAAVADLSRLKQLAAADFDKAGRGVIPNMVHQLLYAQLAQQAAVQKPSAVQQEHNAEVERRIKMLAGPVLHYRARRFGNEAFTYSFSMPVSKWLPGAAEEVVTEFGWTEPGVGPLPGLCLQIINKPYSTTA